MTHFDLSHFKMTDPHVLKPECDLSQVRFSDLNYSSRLAALIGATRERGKSIFDSDRFNDLLNGRRSLQYVIEATE